MKPWVSTELPSVWQLPFSLFDHVEREFPPLGSARHHELLLKSSQLPSFWQLVSDITERWATSLYSDRRPCMVGNVPQSDDEDLRFVFIPQLCVLSGQTCSGLPRRVNLAWLCVCVPGLASGFCGKQRPCLLCVVGLSFRVSRSHLVNMESEVA